MAVAKEYAYYMQGNKLAVVEKDATFVNDPNSRDYISEVEWKSPKTDVANGLEIVYTYAPNYTLNAVSTLEVNKFYVNGWTVIDGYLAFVRAHSSTTEPANWTAAPYSAVGVNEHIMVEGSNRWNGIHKIKDRANTGIVTTWTKVNTNITTVEGSSNVNIANESGGKSKIYGNNNSNFYFSELFSAGEYIFISGSDTAHNNIMWEVDSVEVTDGGSGEEDSSIYVANSYRCAEDIGVNTVPGVLSTEVIDTTPNTTAQSSASMTIYKVYRDFCTIQADISIMQNESFDLDLPNYLVKAVIYYLKARQLEDVLEIEASEYFMSKFRRQVEKSSSSRSGYHRNITGFWGMR